MRQEFECQILWGAVPPLGLDDTLPKWIVRPASYSIHALPCELHKPRSNVLDILES